MLVMVFAADDDWRGWMKTSGKDMCSSLCLLLLFPLSCFVPMLFPLTDASLRTESCLLCFPEHITSEFALILEGKNI